MRSDTERFPFLMGYGKDNLDKLPELWKFR